MATAVLVGVLLFGLALIPFGLPGLWLMIGAAFVYDLAYPESLAGWTLAGMVALAAAAEALEFVLTLRFTKRYGGSQRATLGAIAGSLVGAVVGVPIPIVGSVIGAFLGAFAGAFVAELTRGTASDAHRVATGALIGRAAAAATKVAVGVALAVWIVAAAVVE
jgi:hypothetical protein